eukprot:g207.t1
MIQCGVRTWKLYSRIQKGTSQPKSKKRKGKKQLKDGKPALYPPDFDRESITESVQAMLSRFSLDTKQINDASRESVLAWCVLILNTGDPVQKALETLMLAKQWKEATEQGGSYPLTRSGNNVSELEVAPLKAARDVQMVDPANVPKRGKGGNLKNRIAMIHSLAHIENVAIDLSVDIIARFFVQLQKLLSKDLLIEFVSDWIVVAEDEARHFLIWNDRLIRLGKQEKVSNGLEYGCLPVHNGLWEAAMQTSDDIKVRLAIEHLTLEARGLDVYPGSLKRMLNAGDKESASLLAHIYEEEITHVAKARKWFSTLFEEKRISDVEQKKNTNDMAVACEYQSIVLKRFEGKVKGPFNTKGRSDAGFPPHWYEPLTQVYKKKSS